VDKELERGKKATMELVQHMHNMGATSSEDVIEHDGRKWRIIVNLVDSEIKGNSRYCNQEWVCLECRAIGTYADLRRRHDSGEDTHCGIEVKDISDGECGGCKHEGDCCLDYRQEACYT